MSEFGGLSPRDEQIKAFFGVVFGRVSRDPNPSGFGYIYEDKSIAEPVGEVAGELQTRHDLSPEEVFERMLTASELAVVLRQHIEQRLPEGDGIHKLN